VDFRGFDTLGEISVLGAVALSVYALLRRFRPAPDSIGMPDQQRDQDAFDDHHPERKRGDSLAGTLLVPAVLVRFLMPVMSLVAVFLLLRGHDAPGGGFVAGLALAIALIVQYMAGGARWVEARLRIHPVRWIAAGLLLALATGSGALLFAHPFLTSHALHPRWPLVGEVPLPSAFVFDLGVFVLVVGATTLILVALAHQSLRSPRGGTPLAEDAWKP
jgi:multicomponent K+:H+ antiporter subunit A